MEFYNAAQNQRHDTRSHSPLTHYNQEPQTFIFSDMAPHDKAKFMEFMLTNAVEFQLDPTDQTYTATIKLVNNDSMPPSRTHQH